jgi:hypothetical protein
MSDRTRALCRPTNQRHDGFFETVGVSVIAGRDFQPQNNRHVSFEIGQFKRHRTVLWGGHRIANLESESVLYSLSPILRREMFPPVELQSPLSITAKVAYAYSRVYFAYPLKRRGGAEIEQWYPPSHGLEPTPGGRDRACGKQ